MRIPKIAVIARPHFLVDTIDRLGHPLMLTIFGRLVASPPRALGPIQFICKDSLPYIGICHRVDRRAEHRAR